MVITPCVTPECPNPATTERRVGTVRRSAEDGDTWETRWARMCGSCATSHDDEVSRRGWSR